MYRFLIVFVILLSSCGGNQEPLVRTSMRHYYEPYRINGFLALQDPLRETNLISDREVFRGKYTPASTFKICNSLIGLETGVLKDEKTVFEWDSVMRDNPDWNHSQNMAEAFQHSTVWYYQELARKIGGKQMKYWLDKAAYGNADTTGGIDSFWLRGGLRISPEEQLNFVKKLHNDELPFSKRSMDIVKKVMITKDSADVVFHGKSGWGHQDRMDVGWFVGYAETPERVVYFCNLVRMADTSSNQENFNKSRREVVYQAVYDYLKGNLK
ncbi:MAG TPA: penicillin-binding transpeptidase domain-containing protein [Flavobacteriales bacterium]|nr:penicillin-binding transpeptidase domain-containing protein [Flavobacteriales bacterium]